MLHYLELPPEDPPISKTEIAYTKSVLSVIETKGALKGIYETYQKRLEKELKHSELNYKKVMKYEQEVHRFLMTLELFPEYPKVQRYLPKFYKLEKEYLKTLGGMSNAGNTK